MRGVATRQGAAPRSAAACPLRGGFAGPDWMSDENGAPLARGKAAQVAGGGIDRPSYFGRV